MNLNPLRKTALFSFALLTLCLATPPNVCASPFDLGEDHFGRLIFGCAYSRNNDHSTKLIGGLSAGGYFGENNNHEAGIEFMLSAWQTSRYDIQGNFVSRISETHAPVLLSYRYYLVVPKTPVALHLGDGIGCDIISNSFKPGRESDAWDEENSTWFDKSDIAFAASATGGITIHCGKRFNLDFAYRFLWQSGAGYMDDTTMDGTHNTPKVRIGTRPDIIHMVTAAIGFAY